MRFIPEKIEKPSPAEAYTVKMKRLVRIYSNKKNFRFRRDNK